MTTPNGQHPQDPVNTGEHPASTVLALDGWGPLLPEPLMNGAADEHVDEAAEDVEPVTSARTKWQPGLELQLPSVTIPATLRYGARMLAPAAAIGLALGVAVGGALRWWHQQQLITATPAAPPPSRLANARRALALALDPTLAEPCPPQSALERLLRPGRRTRPPTRLTNWQRYSVAARAAASSAARSRSTRL